MIVHSLGLFPGDPYPELRLDVDGTTVVLVPDQQKYAIFDAGYVYLGLEFESRLPVVRFPVEGRIEYLHGFTDNPEVVRFFREFIAGLRRPCH